MRVPRITGSSSEEPPFAGDLPATIGALSPYALEHQAPDVPAVALRAGLPRLHQRVGIVQIAAFVTLALSTATLALAVVIVARTGGGHTSVPAPVVPPPSLVASGRDGADVVHCMSDVVTVFATGVGSADGVMVGWLDTPNGTLRLVLRPGGRGYRGFLYTDSGVLRTEPWAPGVAIWPDERVLLRVDGLAAARELRVGGRQTRFGSRAEGPCT